MQPSIKIYGIKNCSTMKKAFLYLEELGLSYEFHDYKKQGIDSDSILKWLEHIPQEKILNKQGTTWKKLSLEQQAYALENQTQWLETLQANPSMIKRPILMAGDTVLVGFDDREYLHYLR
ncbi:MULTISPECIES: Spx/MgsR family RNA polymerase-binding regulatory protein [unclassified Acinetobacter]|uniref:Spx/MgsR family RNA polymerase-binding regulatory protein n=1 Tax=unclassified Acinetobacter TaxID=196816 RepID=UPI0035B71040